MYCRHYTAPDVAMVLEKEQLAVAQLEKRAEDEAKKERIKIDREDRLLALLESVHETLKRIEQVLKDRTES